MNQIRVAPSAWDYNLGPQGNIEFAHSIPDDIQQFLLGHIQEVVAQDILKIKSLLPCTTVQGHYCIHTYKEKFFLRIARPKDYSTMEQNIVMYLDQCGLAVNKPMLKKTIANDQETYLMYLYPYIQGRHFDGSDQDLKRIARAVADMHKALVFFPQSNAIRLEALEVAKRLEVVKNNLSDVFINQNFDAFYELSSWIKENQTWLEEMIVGFDPYLCLKTSAQCNHGDLHLGNIIITDDQIFLTDFENSPRCWFPVTFDLAYVVHRFCLFGEPSAEQFRQRLNILREECPFDINQLKNMTRQVCWFSIALILDRCQRRESIVPDVECDKFVNLEKKSVEIFLEK